MSGTARIDFTVRGLNFQAIEQPAERLGIYLAPNDGNREQCLATVIPPGDVEWTEEALADWAEGFLGQIEAAA